MQKILLLLAAFFSLPFDGFSQSWTAVKPYGGSATDGCFSFVINGKAYVGGGLGRRSLFEYDPVTDTWTQKPSVPGNWNRGWAWAFVINNKAYIGGGDNASNGSLTANVQMYDPATNTFTEKAAYGGGPVDGAFACSFNGKGYVFCGFDGTYTRTDVWEYDPIMDKWLHKSDFVGGYTIFPSGFVLGNLIYVGLGSTDGGAGRTDFYAYNPQIDAWLPKASFPGTPRQATYHFEVGGYGYVAGGEENYTTEYRDFFRYNAGNDTWTAMPGDTIPASIGSCWGNTFVLGNEVYMGMGASLPSFAFSRNFVKKAFTLVGVKEPGYTDDEVFYPNPSSGILNLPSTITQAEILDMLGKKVRTLSFDITPVDISDLSKGTYLLRMAKPDGVWFTQRLFLQ